MKTRLRALRVPIFSQSTKKYRDKDVAKVLSAASRPEIRAWLVLMAYQGLRCQDIAELRRESVDLEASPPLLKLGDEKTNWGGSTVLHHEVVSSIRALPIVRGSLFPTETSASISRKIARHFAASGVTGSSNSLLWWYRENVQNLGRSFDREVSSGRTREVELTPIELSVVAALDRLVPGESPCYLQAVSDLNDQNRIAFRGVATEFRELVRVVLDVLAPDSTLMASPGFKLEPGQPKPTQIQKARFILKSNRVSTTARAVPETTVELVEDSVATFARNIHRRSSNALHTETDRSEVQQIKMYVDALLTELLEVHRVLQTD